MRKTFESSMALVLPMLLAHGAHSLVETEEQCLEPDHFLVYQFDSLSDTNSIPGLFLNDRFIGGDDLPSEFTPFGLVEAEKLLNPAKKIHQGKVSKPAHPNTHYVSYSLENPEEVDLLDREVNVFNQFGNYGFFIADEEEDSDLQLNGDGDPILHLLVPAVKGVCPGGSPTGSDDCFPDGDYYLCYDLIPQETCSSEARFKDQFDNRIVENLVPIRLCTPVDVGIQFLRRANRIASNHLLCYSVNEDTIQPRVVDLLSQLGQQNGVVRISDEICVPSTMVVTSDEDAVNTETCCSASDLPGCAEEACQDTVCAIDEFCCENEWDGICAEEAQIFCGALCAPEISDCCIVHLTGGCVNNACEDLVCDTIPSCCDITWDATCVAQAQNVCGAVCGL